MTLNQTQKDILIKFGKADKEFLKFSELKPNELENDLFNYHLKYLIGLGFIEKSESGYSITNLGSKELLLTDAKGTTYSGFRNSVLVYVIDRSSDPNKILVQKRTKLPYFGEVNPGIAGKIKVNELIEDAAKRKLKEETGLEGECTLVGCLRKIRMIKDADLHDDGFFFICICEDFTGDLIQENEFGQNYWDSFENAKKAQADNQSTGELSLKVLNQILNKDYSPFILEERTELKSFS